MQDTDEMRLANKSQGPKMELSRDNVRLSCLGNAWVEGEQEGKQRANRANRGCIRGMVTKQRVNSLVDGMNRG